MLTPEGKAFMMLGISHVDGAFAKGVDQAAHADVVEKQLRDLGFNTVPAGQLCEHVPLIVPLDRLPITLQLKALMIVGDASETLDTMDPA